MRKVFVLGSPYLSFYIKQILLISILLSTIGLTKSSAQSCTPISTLPCEQLEVSLPYSISFDNGVANTLLDKNGAGTGFTMADSYSGTRLADDGAASNSNVPGYEPSQLTIGGGELQILTNKGIAFLNNNNQVNSLGVKVNSQGRLQVETTLINPFNGSSNQQGGLWFGLNDQTFLKLVVSGNKIELRRELNDVSSTLSGTTNPDQRLTGTISNLNTSTVRLRLIVDSENNIAEGFYSTDGISYFNVGAAYSIPSVSISDMSFTATTTYAGIFATHRNSSTPVTYSFDDFKVQSLSITPCTPISTLSCQQLEVNLPYGLSFNSGVSGTLLDKNGAGTGFTMADSYGGTRLADDGTASNSNVPGYEPSQLTISSGKLQILTNKGIAYLNNNNQVNSLGVKVNSQGRLQVETTLINPFNGSSSQQGGLWFGLNDQIFLKLVAIGNKIELRREVNDVSSTLSGTTNPDQRLTATISNLSTGIVRLRLIVDTENNIAEGFYSTDGVTYFNVGAAYSSPSVSISDMSFTATSTYAGIFATHRNSSTPVVYSFDDFSINKLDIINAEITRGPYLNSATQNSIIIRWRTNIPTDSKVYIGKTENPSDQLFNDDILTTEHEIKVTGLATNTTYFYSIGTTKEILQGDNNNVFKTLPSIGSTDKIRVLAMGDMGNNSTNQKSVRDAYLKYMAGQHSDIWILLGDNAYDKGTEAEYQNNFFNYYQDNLTKNHVLWPAPGNHDYKYSSTAQKDHIMPYYDIFSLPENGESGGVVSNSEAYYSYDYGNVHFVSLDSYGIESDNSRLYDTTGEQVTWLKKDLAANKQPWTVVYFHHPPYTKGSHNSDTETQLVLLRENLVKILERYNVDLVLNGHSHCYERSYLINGHYNLDSTFSFDEHAVSTSSGKNDGSSNSCPYIKNEEDSKNGIIFAVVGSSGRVGGSSIGYPHDAMYYSNVSVGGAMVLEIENNRLDAKWIGSDGNIRDNFTILKNVTSGDCVTSSTNSVTSGSIQETINPDSQNPEFSVQAIPNPFNSQFSLIVKTKSLRELNIRIYDAAGRTVYQEQGNPQQQFKFGNDLVPGVYYVQVKQGQNTQVLKILKQK